MRRQPSIHPARHRLLFLTTVVQLRYLNVLLRLIPGRPVSETVLGSSPLQRTPRESSFARKCDANFRHTRGESFRVRRVYFHSSQLVDSQIESISFFFSFFLFFVAAAVFRRPVRTKDSRWQRRPRGLISRSSKFLSHLSQRCFIVHCYRESRWKHLTFVAGNVWRRTKISTKKKKKKKKTKRRNKGERRGSESGKFSSSSNFLLPHCRSVPLLSLAYARSFHEEVSRTRVRNEMHAMVKVKHKRSVWLKYISTMVKRGGGQRREGKQL